MHGGSKTLHAMNTKASALQWTPWMLPLFWHMPVVKLYNLSIPQTAKLEAVSAESAAKSGVSWKTTRTFSTNCSKHCLPVRSICITCKRIDVKETVPEKDEASSGPVLQVIPTKCARWGRFVILVMQMPSSIFWDLAGLLQSHLSSWKSIYLLVVWHLHLALTLRALQELS